MVSVALKEGVSVCMYPIPPKDGISEPKHQYQGSSSLRMVMPGRKQVIGGGPQECPSCYHHAKVNITSESNPTAAESLDRLYILPSFSSTLPLLSPSMSTQSSSLARSFETLCILACLLVHKTQTASVRTVSGTVTAQ